MRTPVAKEKINAFVAGIILLSAVITGFVSMHSISKLKEGLNNERLRNESLLSEKLLLDKEIFRTSNEMNLLKQENARNGKIIDETRLRLTEKERLFANLQKENAKVKKLQKQLSTEKALNDELQNNVNQLNALNALLQSENQQLQNNITQLDTECTEYKKHLEVARLEALRKADNFQVDIYKNVKRDVPTLKAKKMKMMSVMVDVPKELLTSVTFDIKTPDGKVINEKNKSLSWKVMSNDATLTASLKGFTDDFTVTRQVKLTYAPTSKMEPGIYKIGILENGNNIGNCIVRLR